MIQPFCSPLQIDGEPIPIEAFRDLRRVPGFKYEYSEGRARISVQRTAHPLVATTTDRVLSRDSAQEIPERFEISSAKGASVEELEALWVDVFTSTPDYHGYRVDDIRNDARESLHSLYKESSASLHPASRVAKRNGTLVGSLLVTTAKALPQIDVLYLRKDATRHGLATAMLHRVVEDLNERDQNVLCSGYLLANRASGAWHESAGFIELPDWLIQNHRQNCVEYNAQRGLVHDVFAARRRAEALREEVASMRADRREDSEAHAPSRWIKSDGDRVANALARELAKRQE